MWPQYDDLTWRYSLIFSFCWLTGFARSEQGVWRTASKLYNWLRNVGPYHLFSRLKFLSFRIWDFFTKTNRNWKVLSCLFQYGKLLDTFFSLFFSLHQHRLCVWFFPTVKAVLFRSVISFSWEPVNLPLNRGLTIYHKKTIMTKMCTFLGWSYSSYVVSYFKTKLKIQSPWLKASCILK